MTPTLTSTLTPTSTPKITPEPTPTSSPTPSLTPSPTTTPALTPTPTLTPTLTPTSTLTTTTTTITTNTPASPSAVISESTSEDSSHLKDGLGMRVSDTRDTTLNTPLSNAQSLLSSPELVSGTSSSIHPNDSSTNASDDFYTANSAPLTHNSKTKRKISSSNKRQHVSSSSLTKEDGAGSTSSRSSNTHRDNKKTESSATTSEFSQKTSERAPKTLRIAQSSKISASRAASPHMSPTSRSVRSQQQSSSRSSNPSNATLGSSGSSSRISLRNSRQPSNSSSGPSTTLVSSGSSGRNLLRSKSRTKSARSVTSGKEVDKKKNKKEVDGLKMSLPLGDMHERDDIESSDDFYLSSDRQKKLISLCSSSGGSWLGEAAKNTGNVLIKETNYWKVLRGSGRVNWFDLYSPQSLSIIETNTFQDYKMYFYSRPHLNFTGLWKADHTTTFPFTLSVRSDMESNEGYRILLRTPHGDQRFFIQLKKPPKTNTSYRKILEGHVPWIRSSKLAYIRNPGSEEAFLELERDKFTQKKIKVGVIFCDNSNASEKELLTNSKGSKAFEEFLNFLGKKVKLEGWDKFSGGLDTKSNSDGTHSVYTTYSDIEVMFHVSTQINTPNKKNTYLTRKVHVGNDVVVIIWLEDDKPFDPVTISSKFNHVYFVIQPVKTKDPEDKRKWVRVTIATKKDVTTKEPILPAGAIYEQNNLFRKLLLSQIINSEKSAYSSPHFSSMTEQMRTEHLAYIYYHWSGVIKDTTSKPN
eukprot:TRINITY_DN1377_c0_g1_i1.p1 TRINITY_DN1377_c0_g1~~TRINITY_DN1377_c0_g1_i1.p1  ORF type:complete len:767 (+),score=81.03 TRINITY_DN1377_c0_g1_i1:47-2302(+)